MADRPDDGESRVTEQIRVPDVDDWARGARRRRRDDADVLDDAQEVRSWQAYEHARRERRRTLTFLALFTVILLLGVLALAAYFDRVTLPFGSGRPVALPSCPVPSATVQAPGDTSVNVFNASTRNGLALSVARELQKRGFLVPRTPANDPQKTKVTTMAVIRHGATGRLAAQTVATVVAGEVTYVEDERPGSDVDLVLGAKFKLAPVATPSAEPSPGAPGPTPTCVPADG